MRRADDLAPFGRFPTQIFGVQQRLQSIKICYDVQNAASYIDQLYVRQVNDNGNSTDLIQWDTDLDATDWDCDTISSLTAPAIDGSLMIRLILNFGGTGAGHDIKIGKITLTLVEVVEELSTQ